MKRERSARILATLGPASSTVERIRALAEAVLLRGAEPR